MITEQPYRVVIAVDFDAASEYAIREAIRFATRSERVELHFVHVVADYHATRSDHIARDENAMTHAHERLREEFYKWNLPASPPRDTHIHFHIRVGKPAEMIEQVAVDVNADLVIMGCRGRTGLERALFGSISRAVVESGRVPVLVARPKNYEGLEKTPKIEAARPGDEDDHRPLHHTLYSAERVRIRHVSGLL